MPARIRQPKRRRARLFDYVEHYLITGEIVDFAAVGLNPWTEFADPFFYNPSAVRQEWEHRRDEIIAEFVRTLPGRRPFAWWEYDAPRATPGSLPGYWQDVPIAEPRRRLSGTGTPRYDSHGIGEVLRFGLPIEWYDPADQDDFPTASHESSRAFDPTDPPVFESQAAYLARFELLLPDEDPSLLNFAPAPYPISMYPVHAITAQPGETDSEGPSILFGAIPE